MPSTANVSKLSTKVNEKLNNRIDQVDHLPIEKDNLTFQEDHRYHLEMVPNHDIDLYNYKDNHFRQSSHQYSSYLNGINSSAGKAYF